MANTKNNHASRTLDKTLVEIEKFVREKQPKRIQNNLKKNNYSF